MESMKYFQMNSNNWMSRSLLCLVLAQIFWLSCCVAQSHHDYNDSVARYFIPKTTFDAGKILEALNLPPLREVDGHRVFRCTVQIGSESPISILIVVDPTFVRIETTKLIRSQVVVTDKLIPINGEEFKKVEAVLRFIDGERAFFAPLKPSEIAYFSNFHGEGTTVLYERLKSDSYEFIAILQPCLEPRSSERPIIRSLEVYCKALKEMCHWLEIPPPPQGDLDSIKGFDPFSSGNQSR